MKKAVDQASAKTASGVITVRLSRPRAGRPVRDKDQKREAKKRKKQKLENAFRDYFDFSEPITRVPPHRVLAINRGERAKVLRVKIEADFEAMVQQAEQMLAPQDHPHVDLLCGCVRDALGRLVKDALRAAKVKPPVPTVTLPAGVEVMRRSGDSSSFLFVINHGKETAHVLAKGHDLVADRPVAGTLSLRPGAVAVVREEMV